MVHDFVYPCPWYDGRIYVSRLYGIVPSERKTTQHLPGSKPERSKILSILGEKDQRVE